MIRMLLALVFASALLWGHDPSLHRTKTVTGQVTSATEKDLELKSRTGIVKVVFSAKTRFMLNKKPVERREISAGEWIGVVGNEQHNRDFLALEVILGLPAPATASK